MGKSTIGSILLGQGGGCADDPTWKTDDGFGAAPSGVSFIAIVRRTGRDLMTIRKNIDRVIEALVHGPRQLG